MPCSCAGAGATQGGCVGHHQAPAGKGRGTCGCLNHLICMTGECHAFSDVACAGLSDNSRVILPMLLCIPSYHSCGSPLCASLGVFCDALLPYEILSTHPPSASEPAGSFSLTLPQSPLSRHSLSLPIGVRPPLQVSQPVSQLAPVSGGLLELQVGAHQISLFVTRACPTTFEPDLVSSCFCAACWLEQACVGDWV